MLSVVCWKWKAPLGYRSTFGPETVNILRQMVARHYPKPHRLICVTDDPKGIDPGIKIVPLWTDHADLKSPFGPRNPSCYRRLKMFSPEAGALFGPRFVSVDLDCVITGDLAPVWDRTEDFVAWGDTNRTTHYNGSMMLMTAGARRQVWDDFNPETSPAAAKRAGQFGSDQGWISYRLGAGEAIWTTRDGVYSYRNHLPRPGRALPDGARMVMFHGAVDPWSPEAQRLAWVRRNYIYRHREGDMLDVQAINLAKRLAVLSDGRTVPVTHLFDREGDETPDPGEAISFVAGAAKTWFSGAVAHYQQALTQ